MPHTRWHVDIADVRSCENGDPFIRTMYTIFPSRACFSRSVHLFRAVSITPLHHGVACHEPVFLCSMHRSHQHHRPIHSPGMRISQRHAVLSHRSCYRSAKYRLLKPLARVCPPNLPCTSATKGREAKSNMPRQPKANQILPRKSQEIRQTIVVPIQSGFAHGREVPAELAHGPPD
jgi:hypothetical protein